MIRNTSLPAVMAALFFLPDPGSAQDVDVEAFTVPSPVYFEQPVYPTGQLMEGQEALVILNFMVGTDGKPFDPVVSDYMGSAGFRRAALDALAASEFEPATLNGEPIVGSSSIRVEFVLEGGSEAVRESFESRFLRAQRALQESDPDEIETSLVNLETYGANNHYEHAYLNLIRYYNALFLGDELEQMKYLVWALNGTSAPGDPVYLDEELVIELRRTLLGIQLRNNRFAEALDTYALMGATGDDDAVEFFAEAIESVRAVKTNETSYTIPLTLDDAGSAWIPLYKNNIALIDGEGDVAEVKLRCEKRHVAFGVEREISYEVPADWGNCTAEVIGDSGARVFLLQH